MSVPFSFLVCLAATVALVSGKGLPPMFAATFIPDEPAGYTLAVLPDIQSPRFAEYYNAVGLNFLEAFPAEASNVCCVFMLDNGMLLYSPTGNVNDTNFVQPFVGDTPACVPSTQPNHTTFGIPSYSVGPAAGTWFSTLNATQQGDFFHGYTAPLPGQNISNCPIATWYLTTIVKSNFIQSFIVRPIGPDYPAPPSSEYVVASLADIQSLSFTEYYNEVGGISLQGSSTINYCCLIRVEEGWLSFGAAPDSSPLSLLSVENNAWSCNDAQNERLHYLGTYFGGRDNHKVFQNMTTAITSQLGAFTNNTAHHWDSCDSSLPNSLTILKAVV